MNPIYHFISVMAIALSGLRPSPILEVFLSVIAIDKATEFLKYLRIYFANVRNAVIGRFEICYA